MSVASSSPNCGLRKLEKFEAAGNFSRTAGLGSLGSNCDACGSCAPNTLSFNANIASSAWCAQDEDMLDFMENVQNAFYEASHWNVDNSYGALNATARGRLSLHVF